MSGHLWKFFLEDDVDSFRHVLETSAHTTRPGPQKSFAGWQGGSYGAAVNSSPGSYGASPVAHTKARKPLGQAPLPLTRSDINSRDPHGLTILHHAASFTTENAVAFAQVLLEHPLVDLYIQDAENGWTSLHRAFYFGNIAIARLILDRDTRDILGHGATGYNQYAKGLVKIKDREGHGPLDLFSMTIKDRTLLSDDGVAREDDSDDEMARGDSGDRDDDSRRRAVAAPILLAADEVFTFGSNKNVTLGFGDQDDRQFPERVLLRRPDHLLQRFYREHREARLQSSATMNVPSLDSQYLQPRAVTDLPIHIRSTPIVIQDVQMSKLHTAILTTDPCSNLYMCGHGPGGRLGTGSETTRYQFTCIESGGLGQKKVAAIALGQNHTLAITDEGDLYSWGNNAFGQLGYTLPTPTVKDDDPISTIPRQIFGLLKRELITGIAASRIHSVAHTTTSLYTFGKNEGQLGIVDSDARSLDMQIIPRKIAASLFSSSIHSASAIDGATIVLLENRDAWVFANYGYTKLDLPLDGFDNPFLSNSWLATKYDTTPNRISKIVSGGDTICALTTSGQVFTVALNRRTDAAQDASTSTTNPKQMKAALSQRYRVWSAKSGHMAARDVDIDQDGSIILTTETGSVWRRTKRATIKNATTTNTGEYKPKDYKFLRVPGLTRVIAVRASAYGAYAAIRKDCDVTKSQIGVDEPSLWKDLAPLLCFDELAHYEEDSDDENPTPRFWTRPSTAHALRTRTLKSKDLELEVIDIVRRKLSTGERTYDLEIGTSVSDVRIPVHEFIISGRSRVFRDAMSEFRSRESEYSIPELLTVSEKDGKVTVLFAADFLTIFNLILYAYTDTVVDFWNVTRGAPEMAFRYRTVRTELMKLALRLEMRNLEPAVRQMVTPKRSLAAELEVAVSEQTFFESGDVIVDLEDGEMLLHSDLLRQRCPFFEGLFGGRAGGQWLSGRRADESQQVRIDLTHIETHLFELVVRHIYTDAGEEIFDEFTSEDLSDFHALDELLDHVMEIMSIANELMLERLSQICQRLIGRYVNARNVCSLLNAIAPSSVAEFKDAALEYICLSLEAVMQNSSLDELDEDLLLDLNEVVRDNQLASQPFVRSGRATAVLFDKYPELAEMIEKQKRAKIDKIVLSNKFAGGDGFASSSFRAQSLEELSTSPLRQRKGRRASREVRTTDSPVITPALKGKASIQDLMFEMDGEDEDEAEDSSLPIRQSKFAGAQQLNDEGDSPIGSPEVAWPNANKSMQAQGAFTLHENGSPALAQPKSSTPQVERAPDRPWGATPLAAPKFGLKDIMSQATTETTSNLTLGLSKQSQSDRTPGSSHAKVSQKERKRQKQAQQSGQPSTVAKSQPAPPAVSAWQAMSHRKSTPSASPVQAPAPSPSPQPARTSSTPQLTMRQTVANKKSAAKDKLDHAPKQNSRSVSGAVKSSEKRPGSASGPGMSVDTTPIPNPRSVRHIPMPAHSPTSPSQYRTMHEILSEQQTAKDHIKDPANKRTLQEIQQEQEFQQWWDQESKRVMLEQEQQKRSEERAAKAARGRNKGRIGRGGKNKGKDKNEGGSNERGKAGRDVSVAPAAPAPNATSSKNTPRSSASKQEGADKNRGKEKPHRGGRGGGGRGGRGQGLAREGLPAPQKQHTEAA